MEQFATDSLVKLIGLKVDPQARSKNADGQKRGTTSPTALVSLTAMSLEQATKLVRRLLAGFPNLGAHDPEGYINAMIQVMVQYPDWAGQRTINRVDEANPQFPPSDRQLRTWLDDAIRPYVFKAEWEERTKKQLAERIESEASSVPEERRSTDAEGRPIQYITNYDEGFKLYGRPIGRFEEGRRSP